MNNKAILLATMAFLTASSLLMIGGIGIQLAEASGPNCPSKGGAAAIVDPDAPNSEYLHTTNNTTANSLTK